VVVLGVLLVISQADQIWLAIEHANWAELPGALFFTIAGYTCMGLAFAYVSQMIGIRMRLRDLAEIGFISSIINHVVAAGGVAGYSVRYILMNRHGATMNDVAAASLLHFYLTSLDMILMTPIALGYLMLNANIPQSVAVLLGAMTILLTVGAILATLLIFSQNLRQPILRTLAVLAKKVFRRDLTAEMEKFNQTVTTGVRAMYNEPRKLILIMLLTLLDWVASVIVLSHCLDAFGEPVPIGIVITGFVIGMVAGVLSMIPGGLGVQEGSMTGVLMLLGVSFEQAVLGAILFRAIFFIFPYLVSLLFYRRLMRLESSPAD
jgi:uncharacterized protein (TIRG00374 family)